MAKNEEGVAIFDATENHEDYIAHLENQAKVQLDQFLDEFDIDSRHVERIVECGYPPNLIRMAAEEQKAELTLVGANTHSDLQHFLLGDTAEHALRELPCDVLVVRSPPAGSNATESEQDQGTSDHFRRLYMRCTSLRDSSSPNTEKPTAVAIPQSVADSDTV